MSTPGTLLMPHFTALVTLLALILYFWLGFRVAQARAKFGVKAPATTGHPDFERTFRIQMNTLEWMPIFLPAIWLAAIYVSDIGAALIGVVWIAGRVLYMRGYTEAAEKRETGFFVQAIAGGLLWLAALIGVVASMLHA
jgi:glutathione S-transferase